jgi:hypothetical protein
MSLEETQNRIKQLYRFNKKTLLESFISNLTLEQLKTFWENAVVGDRLYNGLNEDEKLWTLNISECMKIGKYINDWIDYKINGNKTNYIDNALYNYDTKYRN